MAYREMTIEEMQLALLNPEFAVLLKHLKIKNEYGEVNGRDLFINLGQLALAHQELLEKLDKTNNQDLLQNMLHKNIRIK